MSEARWYTLAGAALIVLVLVLESQGWIVPESAESIVNLILGAVGGGLITHRGLT